MSTWENVWTRSTPRFTISLDVTDEDMDPADSFEFDEHIEFAREGGWHWFAARVRVLWDHDVIGEDYLGGCSYHSLEDFTAPGGYFRDMIASACADARRTVGKFRNCPLRAA
jgi:hypothetical protein